MAVALRKGQGQRPGRLQQLPLQRVKVRYWHGYDSCPYKGTRPETWMVAAVALRKGQGQRLMVAAVALRKGQGQRLARLRQLPLQRDKVRDSWLQPLPLERDKVRALDGYGSCPYKGSRSETGPIIIALGQRLVRLQHRSGSHPL